MTRARAKDDRAICLYTIGALKVLISGGPGLRWGCERVSLDDGCSCGVGGETEGGREGEDGNGTRHEGDGSRNGKGEREGADQPKYQSAHQPPT